MCACIAVVDAGPADAWWDPDQQTVYVRRGAGPARAAAAIAEIMADLGAEAWGRGLLCWCGEVLPLPGAQPAVRALVITGVMSRGA